MSRIRSRDTAPEMRVRKLLHSIGFRYKLHSKDLAGKPDIVFPRKRKVIFVHGCFFHMHDCRFGAVNPKTNAEFWRIKREANRARDLRNINILRQSGWSVLILWECAINKLESNALEQQLRAFLTGDENSSNDQAPPNDLIK